MQDLKILCPYCNAPYTAEMLETMDLCEGSYTPGCVASTIRGNIDIICNNCKKLVYRKEINKHTDAADEYDNIREKNFNN